MVTVPRSKNPILAKRRRRIIKALRANPNAREVSRAIGGVSYRTVYRIAKAEGIKLVGKQTDKGRNYNRRLTPACQTAIIEALKANPNISKVSRDSGLAYDTVYQIAKSEGIELTLGKPAVIQRASIIEALRVNPNAAQVARELGSVSHNWVCKIAKAEGIKLLSHRPRASKLLSRKG